MADYSMVFQQSPPQHQQSQQMEEYDEDDDASTTDDELYTHNNNIEGAKLIGSTQKACSRRRRSHKTRKTLKRFFVFTLICVGFFIGSQLFITRDTYRSGNVFLVSHSKLHQSHNKTHKHTHAIFISESARLIRVQHRKFE